MKQSEMIVSPNHLITSKRKIAEHEQKMSPFIRHTPSRLLKWQLPKCDSLPNSKTHIEVKWNLILLLIISQFNQSW